MKILKPSFNEMQVRIYPWIMLVVGLMFMAIGSIFTLGFSLSYSISCQDKAPGSAKTCQLKTSSLGLYHSTTPLGELKAAKLISWKNNQGKRQYRIKLIGSTQSTRIGEFGNLSRETGQRYTNQVNAYIQNQASSVLHLGRLSNNFLILFGLLFPTIGLLIVITAKKIQLNINKPDNLFQLSRQNLFGTKKLAIPLNEIKEIILESSRGNKGQRTYRVAIIKKDGEHIPIQTTYDNLYQQKMTLIAALNEFLMLSESPSVTTSKKQFNKQVSLAKIFFAIGLILFLGISGFILFGH